MLDFIRSLADAATSLLSLAPRVCEKILVAVDAIVAFVETSAAAVRRAIEAVQAGAAALADRLDDAFTG